MSVASAEFLRAAAFGDLNRLRSLLAQGVDINSRNKANQTALILATAFKRIEIVQYLILAGADVKVQDELGLTAADWARSDTRITKLLNPQPASAVQQDLNEQPVDAVPQESQQSVPQKNQQETTTGTGVTGAMLRHQKSVIPAFTATLTPEIPVIPEPVSASDEETVGETLGTRPALTGEAEAPAHSPHAPGRLLEPVSLRELLHEENGVDIPMPHIPPTSPGIRRLLRVGLVVLLMVGVVTLILSLRTPNEVKPEPASIPNGATTQTKSAPVVAGALAGTELFLPDPKYPRDATVASGNVTVGIQVSQKGVVVKAKALDGDESLRSAAEKTAWSSAFAPEKLKDKESLIDGTITYSFLKPYDLKSGTLDSGFITDAFTPDNVTVVAGGPLTGAERKLAIPKIPKKVRVEQESATLVVRVNRSGRVQSYRPLDAEARLKPYLIRAARSSTFDPAKLPGEGNVVGIITYKFH